MRSRIIITQEGKKISQNELGVNYYDCSVEDGLVTFWKAYVQRSPAGWVNIIYVPDKDHSIPDDIVEIFKSHGVKNAHKSK